MNREEIIQQLQANHASFISYLNTLTEAEFNVSKDDKWTPGQQLEHIIRAVRPLALAFMLPKFMFSLLYGKANRPSRSYDALVAKYHEKLQAGGRASGPFIPPPVAFAQRAALTARLSSLVDALCKRTGGFNERDLDAYILPHPLLGKLTVREMLYFTAYHVLHHLSSVQKLKDEI